MSVRNLEALLRPSSVALIGASDREGSLGRVVWRNLLGGGFKGPLWPVNNKHADVAGVPAWRDVAALPAPPDLAVICTPAPGVPGIIAALAARGTRAAMVLTAGLSGRASAGGPTWQHEMLTAARPHVLRILGGNCIGALVPGIGLNASFAPGNAKAGQLAFVTQSGALATAMLDWANERGIGFSHFISLGDCADVDFGDMLDYLASDEHTRGILLYIESIRDARKFMSAARAAARNKPVIVVKSGRGPDGARAAASHTGALAGSDAVFDAAIRRAGMLRVDTLEELFDAAQTLARVRPIGGRRLAIVTNGGGAGVLAADALSLRGESLAALDHATLRSLDQSLPATWSHGNPVDIIGDAPVARYQDALRILLAASEVDAVLFIHAPTAIVPAEAIASACLPLFQQATRTLLTCWPGGSAVAAARSICSSAAVACYETPERSVAAWMQLVDYAANQDILQQVPDAETDMPAAARAEVAALVAQAVAQGRAWLSPLEVQRLLAAYGIPALATRMAADAAEAAAMAAQLGFPVALKLVSQQIVHKSDVGGVALHVASEDEVIRCVQGMAASVARLLPHAQIDGYLVQAMATRPQARELIVGAATDPVFGPVLLFGEGGIQVELRSAHAVALPPLNSHLAADLVRRSGCAPLLGAYRGREAVDQQALVAVLQAVSRMVCDLPELVELDINPLLVDADGVLALDTRVRVHTAPLAQRPAIRPYPRMLEEEVQVAGETLLLRPIRPEDGTRLAQFYEHASPQDLRLRFFFSRRHVARSELARYSQIDYDREMTFVALPRLNGGWGAMAAEVRVVCDPDNRQAEFALQVATAWQGKGLGRSLMEKMVRYLRARGTAELVGECLPENAAMAGLARSLGFSVKPGPDVVALHLALL